MTLKETNKIQIKGDIAVTKKAKVIRVKPAKTNLVETKAEPAEPVQLAETAKTEDIKPAVAHKSIEPSPYQAGYDDGYKKGSKDGATSTVRSFIATVEQKLAEHDGYTDPEKWRREATIPAWWIAVLMTCVKGDSDERTRK